MTILTPERLAEIAGLSDYLRQSAVSMAKCANAVSDAKTIRNRAAGDVDSNYGHVTPQQTREWQAAELLAALLASHDALQAEADEWKKRAENCEQNCVPISDDGKSVFIDGRGDVLLIHETELTTARAAAAQRMRERLIEAIEATVIDYALRVRMIGIIRALPLEES